MAIPREPVTQQGDLPDEEAKTLAAAATKADATGWANEVHLVGRVSGTPEERTLPSGDVVVLLRLVVPRPDAGRRTATARGAAKGPAVDTIDVACWGSRPRRAALRLSDGDAADVSGALHRRFYRAGGATASRYEVAATTVARA